ncbi:uncharacterized protein LOC121267101 [Juglans microcarpa x Juglans regia]|uniref:uncharacterized protein LOC121267101 n=1 Tax=Juglans microcarpa x Juglans regia TaxID=2249226 RepID=UPI001B7EF4B9|nr:uncharacterized protein LOC121267101 [Juglans microcarpa x Juglans regia]
MWAPQDQKANKLACAAWTKRLPLPEQVVTRTIEVPAVGIEVMQIQPGAPDWARDILKYLDSSELLEDRQEAQKVRSQAARYTLIEGVLYRRGDAMPPLRCISQKEAQYLLAEIHEGICSNHSGGRALAGKAMRVGYY